MRGSTERRGARGMLAGGVSALSGLLALVGLAGSTPMGPLARAQEPESASPSDPEPASASESESEPASESEPEPEPASESAESPDPLVAVQDADPLELARAAHRLGEAAVLARLDADSPAAVRLAAVRAAPMLRTPEPALTPLAAIALGSDPDLAPAALLAMKTILEATDASALSAHETTLADLTPAASALASIAADESARPDLRAAALDARTRIRAFTDAPLDAD